MNHRPKIVFTLASIFILMSCSLFSRVFSDEPETLPEVTPTVSRQPTTGGELPAPTRTRVSTPAATKSPTVSPTESAGQALTTGSGATLPEQVASGAIQLDGIRVLMEEATGEVLGIQVSNPGAETITVTVPCGLIFDPVGGELQPMIVIYEAAQSVPPGGSAELAPVVACADMESGTPEFDAGYQIGAFAQGDLLALAQCMCQSSADFSPEGFELLQAQFAVWALSNRDLFSSEIDFEDSPLASLLGEEDSSMEELQAAWEALRSMMIPMAGEWFERCNLDVPIPTPESP